MKQAVSRTFAKHMMYSSLPPCVFIVYLHAVNHRAHKNYTNFLLYLWTISGKIGKEIVMRVTYFLSKTVVLLLYPPPIREMSARTCINLDIIIINVNINLCLAVLDQSRGGYLQCLHPHFY